MALKNQEMVMTELSTSKLQEIQELLLATKSKVANLNLPLLGQDFCNLDGQACQNALVAYRFTKCLEPKVEGISNERAEVSVNSMLTYDQAGLTEFQPARMNLDPYVRHILYNARSKLHECLSGFTLDFTNFSFPSGESFDSEDGDVSLVRKLKKKKHWKVTQDCFETFAKVVYHNRWFKKAAQAHIDSDAFYIKHKDRINKYLYDRYKHKRADCGLYIFMEKMKQFVVTIWYGSKITTVPKNVDVDRVIEVEVLGNMVVQRCIALALIKCMNAYYGIDLLDAQWLHKTLIADMENATIDWSNASNSNWLRVVEWFFPKKVFKHLLGSRSGVVSYRGTFHGLNMISPMGNGFTFEVMTCFLLAIARELDSCAMVFGDDVIIHRDVAEDYIRAVSVCGWNPNMKKTFISGSFRESCGGFFHEDKGYLTSFEFELPDDTYDVMVVCNKLFVLLPHIDGPLKILLNNLWNQIINLCDVCTLRWQLPPISYYQIPRKVLKFVCKGAPTHADGRVVHSLQKVTPDVSLFYPKLDDGIFVSKSKWVRLTRQDETSKGKYEQSKRQRRKIASRYCYKEHMVYCISIPVKVFKEYKSNPVKDIKNPFWLAYYFRNNRSMRPVIRNNSTCNYVNSFLIDGSLCDTV